MYKRKDIQRYRVQISPCLGREKEGGGRTRCIITKLLQVPGAGSTAQMPCLASSSGTKERGPSETLSRVRILTVSSLPKDQDDGERRMIQDQGNIVGSCWLLQKQNKKTLTIYILLIALFSLDMAQYRGKICIVRTRHYMCTLPGLLVSY